ncbi:MAG: von Willebrand factor type A domain-containing protein [Deltaproteobacteria bacterium]|nr:von Willebrand factor type A domain-containing protein [Deltaproteobacteria bacterium]
MSRTNAVRIAGVALLVGLGTICAGIACVGDEPSGPAGPRVPLDPSSDWNPSSDWAAKGDREPADGGSDPSGYDSGGYDGGSYADASADSGGRDYGSAEGGADADADGDAGWPSDVHADAAPEDARRDDGGEREATDGACDPDAEDGGDCDAVGDVAPPDAGDGACDPEAEDGGDCGDEAGEPGLKSEDYDEPYVLYLSADDSNSQASPIIVRWLIEQGETVPWDAVRVYEFLNYYDFPYDPARSGRVRVTNEFRGIAPADGLYALQVAVQSYEVRASDRRNVNLTLVLDTSGSMSGRPIGLERDVVRAIADSLRAGDVVSAVEWDDEHSVRLDSHRVSGPADPAILEMAASLVEGGSTDLHGGLVAGYDLARANYREGWLNRVVLVSDGQANTGITDIDIIAAAADDMEGEGIYLVGVGCGDGYNDTLMDAVTDAGRGAYVFIDKESEARRMFVDRFLQTMEVAVRDVQVQLTLPGVFRIEEFHGEEYSTDPAEVDPQHLAPNDAMVFHQLLRAADPRKVWADDRIDVRVTYRDQSGTTEHTTSAGATLQQLVDSPAPTMRKADAIVVYAQALQRIDSARVHGAWDAAVQTCESARDYVGASADALDDGELRDIESLLDRYCHTLSGH